MRLVSPVLKRMVYPILSGLVICSAMLSEANYRWLPITACCPPDTESWIYNWMVPGLTCLFFVTSHSLAEEPSMLWYEELYLTLLEVFAGAFEGSLVGCR